MSHSLAPPHSSSLECVAIGENWRPKGFYRAALEPNVAGDSDETKDNSKEASWKEAIAMPGAIVIESHNDKPFWRYASFFTVCPVY